MQFVTSRSEALDKLNKYIENDISNYNLKRNFEVQVNEESYQKEDIFFKVPQKLNV